MAKFILLEQMKEMVLQAMVTAQAAKNHEDE